MPTLIIGGDSEKPKDKGTPFASMGKSSGGIGGKYSSDSKGSGTLDRSPSEAVDTNARKTEAGKLLLRAIAKNDPKLAAEAVATICNCCDGEEANDTNEDAADDGSDEEGEAE